jgi:hypothetical protein
VLDLVASASCSTIESDHLVATQLDRELLHESLAAFGAAIAQRAVAPVYRASGQLICAMLEAGSDAAEPAR